MMYFPHSVYIFYRPKDRKKKKSARPDLSTGRWKRHAHAGTRAPTIVSPIYRPAVDISRRLHISRSYSPHSSCIPNHSI